MQNELNPILRQYFQKQTLDEVSNEELGNMLAQHPYSGIGRYLLAQKAFNADVPKTADEFLTASLYFHNPLLLDWLMKEVKVEPVAEVKAPVEQPLAFQSYHTIDYFASQGIRLQQSELTQDKLGQQLKSFTEWLKSMKKLPSTEPKANQPQDEAGQAHVIEDAAASIREKEIVTEAMAEVWAKQGNHAKAREIYSKLSLQNPGKTAYFAAKIDHLK